VLTLLASYAKWDVLDASPVWPTLGTLVTFVVLIIVFSIFSIPRILSFLRSRMDSDLMTIMVAALLLLFALVSVKAGYTAALGSFILGAVIADTPARSQVERMLGGTQNLLAAVFFTSVGMLIDPRSIMDNLLVILALSVLLVTTRAGAYALGMLVTGQRLLYAVRTGLLVTPIGEFSFVIAALGVASSKAPASLNAIAVGCSLISALAAPLLVRASPYIASWTDRRQPWMFRQFLTIYRRALDSTMDRSQRNLLWKLTRGRFMQIGRDVVLISGIVVLSGKMYTEVLPVLRVAEAFPHAPEAIYGAALALVIAVPLLALWRNIGALSLICAEAVTRHFHEPAAARFIVENIIRIPSCLLLFVWLVTLLPYGKFTPWMLLTLLLSLIAITLCFRHMLIYWQSKLEASLQQAFATHGAETHHKLPYLLESHSDWGLEIVECQIPDQTPLAGQMLEQMNLRQQFGVSLVGIERQGYLIGNPSAKTLLYPGDRVLILGMPRETTAARDFLTKRIKVKSHADFDDITLDRVVVPDSSPLSGCSLAEARLPDRFGLVVAGIRRGKDEILNLSGEEKVFSGDDLLVLSSPTCLESFRRWLRSGVKK
jgi:CPA2 family monovalent cation:H+ antiporter-2